MDYSVLITILPGPCLCADGKDGPGWTRRSLMEPVEIFGDELYAGLATASAEQTVKWFDSVGKCWTQVSMDQVVAVLYVTGETFDYRSFSYGMGELLIADRPFNLRRYIKEVEIMRYEAEATS